MSRRTSDQLLSEFHPSKADQIRHSAAQIIQEVDGSKEQTLLLLADQLHHPLNSEALITALFSLSEQLVLQEKDFQILVGDESSGRLPSLLVKKLFDSVRRKRNSPPIPFIPLIGGGLRGEQKAALEDYIAQNRGKLQGALIVTEYIQSGESMHDTLNIFRRYDLHPTVAAISAAAERGAYLGLIPNKLVLGKDQSNVGVYLWSKARAAGVEKRTSAGPHPVALKNRISDPDERREIQENINQSRRDIALIAEVFAQLLERKK